MALAVTDEVDLALSDVPRLHLVPDIIEFVVSPAYLNRPVLYPRQATLLKLIFCQDWLLTDYDYEVIDEWGANFALPPKVKRKPGDPLRYEGADGLPPDVLERVEVVKAAGRRWFREVLFVGGRRGGKGYIGAICGAYILYHYIMLGDPQGYFGISRDKPLTAFVFAGKREQAKINQWGDLRDVLVSAGPLVYDWMLPPKAEDMQARCLNDRARQLQLEQRGLDGGRQVASFNIAAKESTKMAGRGPASFMQYYDEMAHIVRETASADAGEVYDASTPALDQFRGWEFIYCGSSPWQMLGKYYENYLEGLEVDPDSLAAIRPERFIIQIASWDIYKDWERAHTIPMVPKRSDIDWENMAPDRYRRSGNFHYVTDLGLPASLDYPGRVGRRPFCRIRNPVQAYDDQMRKEERSNPETFAVERRSRWAAALNAYLNPTHVETMFGPSWDGKQLVMQERGKLSVTYFSHGDPSTSGKNFAYGVAHVEGPDDNGFPHVVFDLLGVWRPGDFEDGDIDYLAVEEDWKSIIDRFMPSQLSFDQFSSASTMAHLRAHVAKSRLPKQVTIFERTATAPMNWKVAETFKTALNLKLVHAPFFELAYQELVFLQDTGNKKVDHPTSGPVQTKDVYDVISILTYALIGDQLEAFLAPALGGPPTAALQGGLDKAAAQRSNDRDVIEQMRAFNRTRTGDRSPGRGIRRP